MGSCFGHHLLCCRLLSHCQRYAELPVDDNDSDSLTCDSSIRCRPRKLHCGINMPVLIPDWCWELFSVHGIHQSWYIPSLLDIGLYIEYRQLP